MAVEMIGGAYCALSPHDPQYRLYELIEQTHTRFILVHWLTKTKFMKKTLLFDLDSTLTNCSIDSDVDTNQLSDVAVVGDNITYIIFTSGSTGSPKGVSTVQCIPS